MTKYFVYLDEFEARARITEKWTAERMRQHACSEGENGREIAATETLPVARWSFEKAKDLCRSYYFWSPGGRYVLFNYLYIISAEYDDDNELIEIGDVIDDYVAEIDERG